MSTETLTSLAMLKVNVDQGKDYLDYMRPFIQHVLVKHKPELVKDAAVRDYIRADFGLEIPERTIQIVLKRLSQQLPLKKENGVYRIVGELPDTGLGHVKADADRHINAVLTGLCEFSKSTAKPISTHNEAVTAICAFLTQFNIKCLRAYLRGTAIPTIEGNYDPQIVLVSKYALTLQNIDPERFKSFIVVVTGHMLANALLCPDLQNAPKTYKDVTFFLDTPLLVRLLGLEGEHKQIAIKNLVELLRKLGGTVATFSHSREELEKVIKGAAYHIDSLNGRGSIVTEARRRGQTKSDLLVLAGQIEDKLNDTRIEVHSTPQYIMEFQIDETVFEKDLADEVSYFNPRAKEYDINSVRSIYVIRRGASPMTIEQSKAVLVTSNSGFSRAAFQYGLKYEESREVSPVITDFSLANIAWLKAPLDAPALPITEVLAVSYAALQPSTELLEKYLKEIDKLEQQGKITERDHQLLRSSPLAQDELMNLTLGEEEALNEQTITETLERVTAEIKKEESEKYKAEQSSHKETLEQLASVKKEYCRIQESLRRDCRRNAFICSWCASIIISVLLACGLVAGFGIKTNNPIVGWLLMIASSVLLLLTLSNLIFGTTVKNLHKKLQACCLAWFIRRKTAKIGIKLDSGDDNFQ